VREYNKVIGWKAWFVDVPHQTEIICFNSNDVLFDDLPKDGCLGVVLYYSDNKPDGNPMRGTLATYDYYFAAVGPIDIIIGCDNDARERNVQQEIQKRYESPVIIRGIWTDTPTIKHVEQEMNEAVLWP